VNGTKAGKAIVETKTCPAPYPPQTISERKTTSTALLVNGVAPHLRTICGKAHDRTHPGGRPHPNQTKKSGTQSDWVPLSAMCPRQDSNLRTRFRRPWSQISRLSLWPAAELLRFERRA